MVRLRPVLIWSALALAIGVPLAAAAMSPLLQWRQPIYIAAGFAGVIALGLLLIQPLLITQDLPGTKGPRGRWLHRAIGLALVATVVVHVAGLWITSPPDVIDALTFTSPTLFSAWGVIAMWAAFAAALMAALRRRLPHGMWKSLHLTLTTVLVGGTVAHALLIEGTMEWLTKSALCALVVAALTRAIVRHWPRKTRP